MMTHAKSGSIDWSKVETAENRREQERAALRAERDRLLAESDWTQLPDARCDAKAWAVYRQALRDLPSATDDPASPKWPVTPG